MRGAGFSSDQQNVPIPGLPGTSVYRAEDFSRRKTQIFKYCNGLPLVAEMASGLETGSTAAATYQQRPSSARPTLQSTPQSAPERPKTSGPSWLEFDRQVLRFYAYFKERVDQNGLELWRVRKCVILFYLEDSTIQVNEPKEDNSGLNQGVFLKRHRVQGSDSIRSWKEVTVGESISLYGREFFVTGCDDFTRDFLHRHGIAPSPNKGAPPGPYETAQEDTKKKWQPQSRPATASESPGDKFLRLDRKVLRFQCCWDNSKNPFGDKLPFVMHYYLVDDTVEIRETQQSVVGRDPFPVFLKRMKLKKGSYGVGGRPPSAGTLSSRNPSDFYHWSEFRLGGTIKVFGRSMALMDCDEFTRQWYRQHLGLEDEQLEPCMIDMDDSVKRPPTAIPPHSSGIGSEEDSLQTVFNLVPKRPPQHNAAGDGFILRFIGKFREGFGFKLPQPRDKDRRFVISYFEKDQTLSIFEVPVPNSGITGGKFLERIRVPQTSSTPSGGSRYVCPQDMFIGARLQVFSRVFELLTADESTLKHMEANPTRYAAADFTGIVRKVHKSLRQNPQKHETLKASLLARSSEKSTLTVKPLMESLRDNQVDISMHEAITLARGADPRGNGLRTVEILRLLGVPV
ncbi:hypothetical protein BSKO_05136 [Bryopsis sp. KO-2023]|nr:hypothetical protein BSKO_05136 [Bryopsis sp. KO-2023]